MTRSTGRLQANHRIFFDPETQAWPRAAKRKGRSAAWRMPIRAVMSGSGGGRPSSSNCSDEAGSSKSRPLCAARVIPRAWQRRLGPEVSMRASLPEGSVLEARPRFAAISPARNRPRPPLRRRYWRRSTGHRSRRHTHGPRAQKERRSAAWDRDGRGPPGRADRCYGRGKPRPRQCGPPALRH